jgi:hypothetical protein
VTILYFNFSHITLVSFSEFVVDGHYYTSPNQQNQPPTVSFSDSEPLPDNIPPSQLRNRVWAHHHSPYLPFVLKSPFNGCMTSRFATPPEDTPLEKDKYGYHLPVDVARSWKTLEQSCRQVATVLRSAFERNNPKVILNCSIPLKPSEFGYFVAHTSEEKARSALSESLDAFVLLFAYVSFCIAISRAPEDPSSISLSTSTKPRWFLDLSDPGSKIHPEFLQRLADSPIADFTTTPQRVGLIINVAQCSWLHLCPYMWRANVPVWFYWGFPPVFVQPLLDHALLFAPRSHPQSRAPPALPINTSTSVQPVGPRVSSSHGGHSQRPGETWNDFFIRQKKRRMEKLLNENDNQRRVREGREKSAAKKSCPGKKGPTVFIWENDDGVWTRTPLSRGQVEGYWGSYTYSQKLFNSIDNCWDLCCEFDEGTKGNMYEYDSNDSDNDIFQPKNGRSGDDSACPPILVDQTDGPPTVVDLIHDQVTLDLPSMVAGPTPLPPPTLDEVASDPSSMDVDSEPLLPLTPGPPILVDQTDGPPTVVDLTHDKVTLDLPSTVPGSTPLPPPDEVASDPSSMNVDSKPLLPLTPGPPILVDQTDGPPTVADLTHDEVTLDLPPSVPGSTPLRPPTPDEVASNSSSTVIGSTPLRTTTTTDEVALNPPTEDRFIDDEELDPYDASRQDVLTVLAFVPLNLEPMPITTLDDLLYYRYGFSLNENPYTGIPLSVRKSGNFRSWIEVCRAVGGQHLDPSSVNTVNSVAIQDFLSILTWCDDPLRDVPGKYWDLSPLGQKPIAEFTKFFISVDERRFKIGKQWHYYYLISPPPRMLHPDRDTNWVLGVDSMTALECLRRRLGPHTIDIANFLINYGVRFRTFQRIPESQISTVTHPLPRATLKYQNLGHRSVNHQFDLADFAGYEALRDAFFRLQPHGPLALREGGIIARLAREVIQNSQALTGPSPLAMDGHRGRLVCDGTIYVDDQFSEAELGLICGTYALGNASDRGMRIVSKLSCY